MALGKLSFICLVVDLLMLRSWCLVEEPINREGLFSLYGSIFDVRL